MEPRIAFVSLWAEDVAAATRFYCDVIGLRLLFHQAGKPHFDLNGTYLVIVQGKPQTHLDSAPERFPVVAFQVPSLEDAMQALETGQVEMPWGIEEEVGYRCVTFYDPAGNLIQLVQYKVP